MKAVDYIREKNRMCNPKMCECPLSKINNGKNLLCENFEKNYPEQAVAIVEKWAKEHPVKTYLSVLLEKFPNAPMEEIGEPKCCVENLFGSIAENEDCFAMDCKECWNREYKEEN